MGEIIETTCNLIDRKLNEMEIQQEGTPVRMTFLKSQVESFREVLGDDDEPRPKECALFLKSGCDIIINMSYDDLLFKLKT